MLRWRIPMAAFATVPDLTLDDFKQTGDLRPWTKVDISDEIIDVLTELRNYPAGQVRAAGVRV